MATRQQRSARVLIACIIVLAVTAAGMAVTMITMHGLAFFVFRSAGTGATSDDALAEDQGPGQPDEPPVLLAMTAPDGTRLSFRGPARDDWAVIALEKGQPARWALLAAGTSWRPVLSRAAGIWEANKAMFETSCVLEQAAGGVR